MHEILQIDQFKIDLPMIAAFLTLIGFSVNDTIGQVFENRFRFLLGHYVIAVDFSKPLHYVGLLHFARLCLAARRRGERRREKREWFFVFGHLR